MQVMFISRHAAKEATADLLRSIKRKGRYSNVELADMMGCSEATVRQRLDDSDPGDQMTVHELLRLLALQDDDIRDAVLAVFGVVS